LTTLTFTLLLCNRRPSIHTDPEFSQVCWSERWTCKRTWHQNSQVEVQGQRKWIGIRTRVLQACWPYERTG